MIDLAEEFEAVISALAEHGIEYAVCGGLAMAIHGFPRATVDIDLLIPAEAALNSWMISPPVTG